MTTRITSALSFFGLLVATAVFAFTITTPAHAATVSLSSLQSGDLIRGTSHNAVYYYGADGFRYVFGNDKVYFTWYNNFDSVKWLSDADLGTVQIGGNVTYHPGVRMIKVNSDPKTYAVDKGGTIRWVTTESAAIALYGNNWNQKIDDVPDGFFSNYTRGTDINTGNDFVPATVTPSVSSINIDKSLVAPATVTINTSAYSPTAVTISVNGTVRWTNTDTTNHTVTSDDLTWGSGTMSAGVTFVRRFHQTGVYTFFDSYNSKLTGTVIVQ